MPPTYQEGPYKDAGGRMCLLVGEKLYYLNTHAGVLMCETLREWTDKKGKAWKTPERRKVQNERIRRQLLQAVT